MLPFFTDDESKSLRELIGLRGTYRDDSLLMAIDGRIQRYVNEPYTQTERIILAIEDLERHVNSDGFESFFLRAPQYAGDIVNYLRLCHCPNTADIVEKAVARLGSEILTNRDEVVARASEVDFSQEEDAFFVYPDDIAELLMDYITENQSSIRIRDTNKPEARLSWFNRIFFKK